MEIVDIIYDNDIYERYLMNSLNETAALTI